MGSAGAKTMAVVRGEADAYLHAGGMYEWDSAAPVYDPQEPTAEQLELLQDEDVKALQERIQTLQQRLEGEGDLPPPDAPEAEESP